jgi:uncharacterized protein (DUF1501 family)
MDAAGRGAVSARGFSAEAQRIGRLMAQGYNLGFVDVGGWDTHVNQGGVKGDLATRLGNLGDGLAQLPAAMGPAWRDTTVVVISEFGRTFRQNGNRGTDHGHGSAMLVLGDGVRGGRMFGAWPGLDTPRLDQGVDLAATTDHRPVLAELLTLSGRDQALVFPGLPAPAPLGLLA